MGSPNVNLVSFQKKTNRTEETNDLTTEISIETIEAKRLRNNILKMLRKNNCQRRTAYCVKFSFKNQGEIKTHFHIYKNRVYEQQNFVKGLPKTYASRRRKIIPERRSEIREEIVIKKLVSM